MGFPPLNSDTTTLGFPPLGPPLAGHPYTPYNTEETFYDPELLIPANTGGRPGLAREEENREEWHYRSWEEDREDEEHEASHDERRFDWKTEYSH